MKELYISTTFLGPGRSDVELALSMLHNLDIDGVELGSTHLWKSDFLPIIQRLWQRSIATHNFFPPLEDENFIINIASQSYDERLASINYLKSAIDFAVDCGANFYTIHPGFRAEASLPRQYSNAVYDFDFSSSLVPYQTSWDLMIDSLSSLIKYAEIRNISLLIETQGTRTKPGVVLLEKPSEYTRLFNSLDAGLGLNFNVAHSYFASQEYGFSLNAFINDVRDKIHAVEISHNDGFHDNHKPLVASSYVFPILDILADMKNMVYILEFRNSSIADLTESIRLIKNYWKRYEKNYITIKGNL